MPHLLPAPPGENRPRVEIRFESTSKRQGLLRRTYAGRGAALEFAVDSTGGTVWANWHGDPSARSIPNATALLLGPVLGGVLRIRRTVSLHGCVIDVGSQAVVLLAEKGCGKSTLAAALAQRGCPVLADDVAALYEQTGEVWIAEAGYPRIRLDPATVDAIGDPADPPSDAGPVMTGIEKRYLALSTREDAVAWRFQPRPLPVGSIYEIERVSSLRAPAITAIAGAERLTTLVRHARAPLAPLDRATKTDEFARLSRLAASTEISRLACPDSLEGLDAVCDLLVAGPAARATASPTAS